MTFPSQLERFRPVLGCFPEQIIDPLPVGGGQTLLLGGFRSVLGFLGGWLLPVRLFDRGQEFPQLLLHRPGLVLQFGEVEPEPGHRRECLQDG
ncbi:MAG TPA: hypothetical protein VL371_14505 [Gemmataceae bacterium]|jgi:hypothetical protein|nr:hypothetical protein [Gemmataceae bacterium]